MSLRAVSNVSSSSSSSGPQFSATNSADQAITAGTPTKVVFPTEVYDTDSYYATSRFTPLVAGYYLFEATIGVTATSMTRGSLFFYKNGAVTIRNQAFNQSAASNFQTLSGTQVIYLDGVDDYVEVYTTIEASSNATVYGTASPDISVFSGQWLHA